MSKPKLVGHVDVDAGCIWVGDPCYVLHKEEDQKPKDIGKDWSEFCDLMFDRSGYNKQSNAWSDYDYHMRRAWIERLALVEDDDYDSFARQYKKDHPFTPPADAVDTHVSNFAHDGGHGGMGLVIGTAYGDGTYPVYVEYNKEGRPSRVIIDFEPKHEEDEE